MTPALPRAARPLPAPLAGWVRQASSTPTRAPVLLVHGIHGSAAQWTRLAALLPADRTIVATDLRGHGTAAAADSYRLADYVSDVVSAMDALGLDRVHLVGTSFGGSVVCAVAAAQPRRALTITALGAARVTGGERRVADVIEAVRKYGPDRFFAYTIPRYSMADTCSPELIDEQVRAAHGRDENRVIAVFEGAYGTDIAAIARTVACPAFVATGELDRTCPPEAGWQLAQCLGVELVVLPGVGHFAMIEDPHGVAHRVGEFIGSHEPART